MSLCKKAPIDGGFTLIELLVVISIIGMLSSVVLAAVSNARQKATDSKFIQEMYALRTALSIYRSNTGNFPSCCGGIMNDMSGSNSLDTALAPLVTQGIISKIPHYPGWTPGTGFPGFSTSHAYVHLFLGTYEDSTTEYMCGPMTYADWKPGTQPGILAILVDEQHKLALPRATFCTNDPEMQNCFSLLTVEQGDFYCIQLI